MTLAGESLSRNAAACDGPSCDTWSRAPEEHGFMQLTWGTVVYMFCSADCCLRYLADNSTPMVMVPND